MTAINSSVFGPVEVSRVNIDFSVDVYDFDNEVYTYEVRAHSQNEAGQKAAELAMLNGIMVSYTCAYAYEY